MVRYDLFLKDGRHIKMTYACFGLLNDMPWGTYNIYSSLYPDQDQVTLARAMTSETTPNNVSFVQYLPEGNFYTSAWSCPDGNPSRTTQTLPDESTGDAKIRAMKEYFKEMKLLLDDLPMLKGAVTLHPLAKCIRVHIPGNEADKVALSLFLFRNLAQDEYIHGYRKLRKAGYRPRIAAVIAHTLTYSPASPFQGERWYATSQDENSWVNPLTFGKLSFITMIKQGSDWNPWFQDLFESHQNGYWRDSHFRDNNEVFNISCDEDDEDSSHYRRLTDAFSLENDSPLHTSQRTDTSCGFYWNELPDNPVETIFDPLIAESGISKSL